MKPILKESTKMKLTEKQKEEVFIHSIFYLGDKLNKRIKKLTEDYNKKMFGLRFFVDTEYWNFITDIIWYRQQLQIHLSLAKQSGIKKDSFAIEQAEHYLWRIKDLEFKGVIQAMRLDHCYFGYSKAYIEKSNKELSRIAKEVMAKIIAEKNLAD